MKWMLVIMIFGTQAVKTDLIFDTLDLCLVAEERARAEMTAKYNSWRASARGHSPPGRAIPAAPHRDAEPCDLHSARRAGDQIGLAGATHNA